MAAQGRRARIGPILVPVFLRRRAVPLHKLSQMRLPGKSIPSVSTVEYLKGTNGHNGWNS